MQVGHGGLVQLEDGNWVEEDVLRICKKVQEYDPNLKIQYLEQADNFSQAPYRLLEKGLDGQWRVVFDIWQLDDRVLHRVYAIDNHNVDVEAELVKANARIREAEKKAQLELSDHHVDLTKSILDSPKDNYTAPVDDEGTVKIFSSLPREDNAKK